MVIHRHRLAMFSIAVFCLIAHHAADAAVNPRLIWSDRGMNTIRSAKLDGSASELLISGLGEARGVDVDSVHGWMYWADNGKNKIQRSRLDGSQIEDVITTGLGFPAGVAVDGQAGKLYWADANNAKIQRSNLDGSQIEDLVTGLKNPYFLALDVPSRQVYWTDYGSRKIQRASFDGTNRVDLVNISAPSSLLRGIDLDLVNRKMYWTDRGTDQIQRANLDGSQMETLHTILPPAGVDAAPHGVTIDLEGGHIFWVDNGTVKLQRADLDGANVIDVLTQASGLLQRPWEIVFLPGVKDPPPPACDLNGDKVCSVADIDLLSTVVRAGTNEATFDLNRDQKVDQQDRIWWVETEMKTYFGDSNLDGQFNSGDLVTAFQIGEYEDAFVGNSLWAGGDWDGDGEFQTRDLVFVFQRGGFEAGPRASIASVPEPAGLAMATISGLMIGVFRGRRMATYRCTFAFARS